MPDWLPGLIAALVVAIGANVGAWFLIRPRIKQTNADAAESLTGSALSMVKRWERRVIELEACVTELDARVKKLERENEGLRHGASRLESQLDSLNIPPVWRMKDLITALKAPK